MIRRTPRTSRSATSTLLVAALAAAATLVGCASGDRDGLEDPQVLTSPYDDSFGDVLWAVTPLTNESGTSAADELAISDALVASISQARGITVLPLNRSIAAMRALGLQRIDSPADARAVASHLGVSGVVSGSVTAYDPYDPPALGLALALYAAPGGLGTSDDWVDPYMLQSSFTDHHGLLRNRFTMTPVSVVAVMHDASSHDVQFRVREYAEGRHEEHSALGWRRYMSRMADYTKFVTHDAARRLLASERQRLSRAMLEQRAADARRGQRVIGGLGRAG